MEDQRLHDKVDKLDARLDSVDKTLSINTVLLEEHIKRTNILESSVKDVESHVTFVRKLIKLGAWAIGTIIAVVALKR